MKKPPNNGGFFSLRKILLGITFQHFFSYAALFLAPLNAIFAADFLLIVPHSLLAAQTIPFVIKHQIKKIAANKNTEKCKNIPNKAHYPPNPLF